MIFQTVVSSIMPSKLAVDILLGSRYIKIQEGEKENQLT